MKRCRERQTDGHNVSAVVFASYTSCNEFGKFSSSWVIFLIFLHSLFTCFVSQDNIFTLCILHELVVYEYFEFLRIVSLCYTLLHCSLAWMKYSLVYVAHILHYMFILLECSLTWECFTHLQCSLA